MVENPACSTAGHGKMISADGREVMGVEDAALSIASSGSKSSSRARGSTARSLLERLGESGATHDSQSASRSGVEAWVARNLNGWDDSDAGLSEG